MLIQRGVILMPSNSMVLSNTLLMALPSSLNKKSSSFSSSSERVCPAFGWEEEQNIPILKEVFRDNSLISAVMKGMEAGVAKCFPDYFSLRRFITSKVFYISFGRGK